MIEHKELTKILNRRADTALENESMNALEAAARPLFYSIFGFALLVIFWITL